MHLLTQSPLIIITITLRAAHCLLLSFTRLWCATDIPIPGVETFMKRRVKAKTKELIWSDVGGLDRFSLCGLDLTSSGS